MKIKHRSKQLRELIVVAEETTSSIGSWDEQTAGSDLSPPDDRSHSPQLIGKSKRHNEQPMNVESVHALAIPVMDLPEEGLSLVDRDRLRMYVQPIWRVLESLDAQSLLHLRIVPEGAELKSGVKVQPIHDQISPPRPGFRTPCVRYLHVSEVPDKYSIGIFVFPPHATIPLHDHPGMCVLSRVLYGDIQRLSLDLAREGEREEPKSILRMLGLRGAAAPAPPSPDATRAYRNGVDRLVAPAVTMLYPYEGNLHEFVAGPHGAAVLDVLLPPYDSGHHRDCTFYYIQDDGSSQRPCWIIPTRQPEDFHCLSGSYRDIGDEY